MKGTFAKILLYPFTYFKFVFIWAIWRYKAKRKAINKKLISLSADIVLIDIGASYFLNPNWRFALSNKENQLIAIEPNEKNLLHLKNLAICKVETLATAISSDAENKILYVTNEDSGSSLFKPVISRVNFFKVDSELESYLFPYEEKLIETRKLIDVLQFPSNKYSSWIKVDTQGAELDILKSSKTLLVSGRVTIVEVEGSLLYEPIMKGGCKALDIIAFMEECGFELIKFVPLNSKKKSNQFQSERGYLNESDLVFGFRTERFDSWETNLKKSLFAGYISYGLVDLGYRLASKDEELKQMLNVQGLNIDDYDDFINTIEALFVQF